MRKYKKIAHVIDAIQLTQENIGEVCEILGVENTFEGVLDIMGDFLYIQTKEDLLKARFGDYIIRGIEGEFYPCAKSIFLKSYSTIECEHALRKEFSFLQSKEYIYCAKCGKEFSKEGEENE